MEGIDNVLPSADGVACFNRMYLGVTQQVKDRLTHGFFDSPAFMEHLDVVFANIYFAALDAAVNEQNSPPPAWAPLLEARSNRSIYPIQFAFAGMNAHINHDLPMAVVAACVDLATTPTAGTHLADYQKVDGLLDAAEQSVRQSFESSAELAVDRHLQAVEDLVCNWTINSARDLAWGNALLLWELRDDPFLRGLFLGNLAASAALASRLLLVAV
jgi:hypothetical protein